MLAFQAKKHNLTVNLTTFRIWCYVCEREVFLEHRASLVPVSAAPHHCKVLEQVLFIYLGSLFQICIASSLITLILIVRHNRFFQEAAAQPVGHAVKGVPIAVAEEEGSESEEDELKPRGMTTLQHFSTVTTINIQLQGLLLPFGVHIKLDVAHCFKGLYLKV